MSTAWRFVWLIMLAGCALASRNARRELDGARLVHARAIGAEQRAPLSWQRQQAARRAAEQSARDSRARADYDSEARLWLETAIAETERELASEQRLREERALLELDAAIVSLSRERAEVARTAELLAAQALAREEAAKALARAAARPELRVKLSRDDQKRAAEALLTRAELIALSLESLGQTGAALTALRQQLVEARALAQKEPGAALARADRALFAALALLGELRGRDGPPDPREQASLSEALASAGAAPTRGDQGLTAVVPGAFKQGALAPEAERVVERLCALAQAHARGPVRLAVQAASAREAEARTRALRKHFGKEGCLGERFVIAEAKRPGDALEASWLAY